MKTFKLKALMVIEYEDDTFKKRHIPLVDGLIIDREDENNRWLIEAYTTNDYLNYFQTLKEYEEIMVQVKISKETNDPATFMTTIINLTEIGEHLSVLFIGTIIDSQQHHIEVMLGRLIEEGYQGKDLLEQFKQNLFNH